MRPAEAMELLERMRGVWNVKDLPDPAIEAWLEYLEGLDHGLAVEVERSLERGASWMPKIAEFHTDYLARARHRSLDRGLPEPEGEKTSAGQARGMRAVREAFEAAEGPKSVDFAAALAGGHGISRRKAPTADDLEAEARAARERLEEAGAREAKAEVEREKFEAEAAVG